MASFAIYLRRYQPNLTNYEAEVKFETNKSTNYYFAISFVFTKYFK